MNKAQAIIFGVIGVVVLIAVLIITGVLPGLKERTPASFTLVIWGSRDKPELWRTVADAYRTQEVESATIEYVKKDPGTYEAELLNALAAGRGPDIFLLSDPELERHRDKIAPLDEGLFGYRKRDLKNIFADGAIDVISDASGSLFGTPLSFDTLALFFNRDHLNAANIPAPPGTWEELVERASVLTKLSSVGGIQHSGIALGTASNVEHAGDILAALMYQSGGRFVDSASGRSAIVSPASASAVALYTSFADTTRRSYSWNAFFASSLRAFADGETSMAIGYAADVPTVAAVNPQLNFDVALFPQPVQAQTPITVGRLEIATVSRNSNEQEQAWRFLLWLQSKDVQKTYSDAVGLPSPRRDLVNSKPPQEYLTPFYDQVLRARALPVVLGGSLRDTLTDIIDGVTTRRFSIDAALSHAEGEINKSLETQ